MIESTLFPTLLLDFNRTLSNPLSEQDGANTMERYTLPTHPEKPYKKSDNNRLCIETFEHKFAKPADKGENSLGKEVVVAWVDAVWATGKVWGCLFYFTQTCSPITGFRERPSITYMLGLVWKQCPLKGASQATFPSCMKQLQQHGSGWQRKVGKLNCVSQNPLDLHQRLTLHCPILSIRGNIRRNIQPCVSCLDSRLLLKV